MSTQFKKIEAIHWNPLMVSKLIGDLSLSNFLLKGDKRIENLQKVDSYIKGYSDEAQDKFKKSLIIDRLGKGNYKLFKPKVIRPYRAISIPKNFTEAIELNLSELIKIPHKKILIFWSGGVDSTVILISLLKNVDWKKIIVIHNEFDKQGNKIHNEYPLLNSWLLKNQIEIINFETYYQRDNSRDLVLHGLGGDAVWGYLYNWYEGDNAEVKNLKISNKSWRETNTFNFDADTFDFFNNFCLESDIDIITTMQARCWFFQTVAFQGAIYGFSFIFSSPTSKQVKSFYDNDYLNRWVLSNSDKIVGKTLDTYKMPAKEYINDFFPDRNYLKNMKKKHSLGVRESWLKKNNNKIPFLLDTDGVWHTLPSQPELIEKEFLQWNKIHNWLPING
jgi:hypothetical protein